MGDDILKKDVYNVLFLTYQNVGNFEIGVENEIKVDVCVVCVYTRSMHLPLNGEVYGVVRNIYTQRGICVTCLLLWALQGP